MKKFILSFIVLLFLAATFPSHNPPGWYQVLNNINDQINDICFLDTLTGYITTLGDNSPIDTGYVMKTTNGGTNWVIQIRNAGNMDRVQFLNKDSGYAFGNVGFAKFFKTTNGGNNWQDLSSSVPIYFSSDMFFVNQNTGWISSGISDFGGLAKTTNGGVNWQVQLNASYTPSKLFFINQDTGWAVCMGFYIYKTVNGGTNWNMIYNSSNAITSIAFFNGNTGWIKAGPQQTPLARTTDGGFTWKKYPDPVFVNSGIQKIQLLKSNKGWISTTARGIYSLINDTLWGVQATPTGNHGYNSIFMFDSLRGFAGGDILIKTDDGGGAITGINSQGEEIASAYKLYQNYPNPFNPSTKINYELKITNYVTIKVFDLQGKEIQTLVNKKHSAGSYSVEFNGSNLSSGIYFYTLQINDFKETKKMILMK